MSEFEQRNFSQRTQSFYDVVTERPLLGLSSHAGIDSIQPFFKSYPLVDAHTYDRCEDKFTNEKLVHFSIFYGMKSREIK